MTTATMPGRDLKSRNLQSPCLYRFAAPALIPMPRQRMRPQVIAEDQFPRVTPELDGALRIEHTVFAARLAERSKAPGRKPGQPMVQIHQRAPSLSSPRTVDLAAGSITALAVFFLRKMDALIFLPSE